MNRSTINDMILDFPEIRADKTALIFLDKRGEEFRSFTYAELRSQCIQAAKNLANQTEKGAIVLLPIEDQAAFTIGFFACLLSGRVPAPLPPFRNEKDQIGMGRARKIVQSGTASIIVIAEAQRELVTLQLQAKLEPPLKVITLESLQNESSSDVVLPEISADDIAYIQYTSGSTSAPQGVVLRHKNVISNLGKMYRVFNRTEMVRIVGWLPFYHDMGLVGHLFTVLYESGFGVFLPPAAFLASPEVWIKAISKYKGTTAAAPTFALEQCTLRAEAKKEYDLHSLKELYVGSETVTLGTLERFAQKFSTVGLNPNAIRPVYGLAEATLLVAGGGDGFEDIQNKIEARKSGAKHERMLLPYRIDTELGAVAIHDSVSGEPLAEGVQGEIYIKAPHNSEGYINDAERQTNVEAPLVKTGDIGYTREGFLYFTGRSKEIVIVRGVNYNAEDLEFSVRYNEDLLLPNDQTVCVAHIDAEKERLLVFQEVHRHTAQNELNALSERIRANMLEDFGIAPDEIHLVPRGIVPKTHNHKIARSVCLRKYLDGELSTLFSYYKNKPSSDQTDENDPVVIVGMACRFPGGAENVDRFWELLSEGFDGITEIPDTRWDHKMFYEEKAAVPGKMNTKWSGFTEGIDLFDAGLFNVSPSEAPEMDPQQRMLLETSWRLLENTGWKKEDMVNSDTGVFVGISNNDYLYLKIKLTPDMKGYNAYTGLGNSNSVAANRISYYFDLKGPSLAVDTACSSSLTAFHLGAKAVQNGDCKQAIVGGVNAILSPGTTITLSQFGMMSPVGRCKAFDASADGYVRAEGCGLVMLKKQSDALKDGDRILAKLAASAIGQDGHSPGMTFPNGAAQKKLINHTLKTAGLEGAAISYIEAHGTGTPSGDPVELAQIAQVYGGTSNNPCYVGSVKANIGHLETAAGVAGIIKSVLMLQHHKIPPQVHMNTLNPDIHLENTRLKIPAKLEDWFIKGDKRRAAISSFGFGGSLAHAILEEPDDILASTIDEAEKTMPKYHYRPFLLSAPTIEALTAQTQTWIDWLDQKPDIHIEDICYTQALQRSSLKYRQYLFVQDKQELRDKLTKSLTQPNKLSPVSNTQKTVCFLFTGQGEHYTEMGHEMYTNFPVFRAAFDRCAKVMDESGDLSMPFKDLIFERTLITEEYDNAVQPGYFAIQYALMMLWQEAGITPHVMLGHSLGEFAAACMAGCFEPEVGMKILKKRADLVSGLKEKGRMATIFTSLEEVLKVINPEKAEIACINSPQKVVVTGDSNEIQRIVDHFDAAGVRNFALRTYMAFHSYLLDPILEEFEAFVAQFEFAVPNKRWISSVTGMEKKDEPTAKYWVSHLRNTVQFQKASEVLKEENITQFIEVGPSGNTLLLIRECLDRSDLFLTRSISRPEKDRTEMRTFFDSLGKLYQEGYAIHWGALLPGKGCPNKIPGLTFSHKSYWLEALSAKNIARFAKPFYQSGQEFEAVDEIAGNDNWHYNLEWVKKGEVFDLEKISELDKVTSWVVVGSGSALELELTRIVKSRGHFVYRIGSNKSSSNKPNIKLSNNPTKQEIYDGLTKIFYELSRANVEKWNLVFFPEQSDTPNDMMQITDLEQAVSSSLGFFIPFLKALKETVILPPIWIPTLGSQAVTPKDAKHLNLGHAPLWGFAKTLFLEHPEWRGGLIDLDPNDSVEQKARLLVSKIIKPAGEQAVAVRAGEQYVEQLVPKKRPTETGKAFREDGAFLITGGLGGLGLKTAEWVISKGGKHLILMSRTEVPPQNTWKSISPNNAQYTLVQNLLTLEEKGAKLEIASQDVRDVSALEALFASLKTRNIPVRGVLHAAGVNWFDRIMDLNEAKFFETLKIKVSSTWTLHKLTLGCDLDCFILFSSVSALWGSVNLSHYTAANLFMDMVSHYRAHLGEKGLCIDWGPWADVGMSAKTEEQEVLEKIGFNLMTPEQSLKAMEAELNAGTSQCVVGDIDWGKYQIFSDFTLQPSLFDQVTPNGGVSAQRDLNDLDHILTATPQKARELIEEVVRIELRSVILLETADRIDAEHRFNFLGMDSLMAILLVTKLEEYFNVKLANTLAYNYPHIKAVSDYLFELVYLPHHKGVTLPEGTEDASMREIKQALSGVDAQSETTQPISDEASHEITEHPDFTEVPEKKEGTYFRHLIDSEEVPSRKLFCFPYAGSGVSVFGNLAQSMSSVVEVIGIQPPGKEDRSDEEPYTTVKEMVQSLLEDFEPPQEPYYVFGHSLGALLAYEFYVGLKLLGKKVPEHLFLSSCKAPEPRTGDSIHGLPDDEFIEAVLSKYQNSFDRETRRFVLRRESKLLRADVAMLETYVPCEEEITIPFTVFAGDEDPLMNQEKLRNWALLAGSEFKLSYLKGDHDLIAGSHDELTGMLRSIIGKDPSTVFASNFEKI